MYPALMHIAAPKWNKVVEISIHCTVRISTKGVLPKGPDAVYVSRFRHEDVSDTQVALKTIF